MTVDELHAAHRHRPLVPARDARSSSTTEPALAARAAAGGATPGARAKRHGLLRQAHRPAGPAPPRARPAQARWAAGVRPVYKRVDTCAAEFEAYTPYLYSTYEEECEAAPTDRPQGDDPGRRAQPHRPGHRVRLLLRPRRLRAARGRVRDHHGQLQPGDGLHRLRHQRPALLRAAHPRGRARDRPRGEAQGAHRPVRRPDPAQAGRAARASRACPSSAPPPTPSTGPRTASASPP